jgi:PhnB protein
MTIHEAFPYLRVHDARAAIAYYTEVFQAKLLFQLVDPENGRIGHAEIELAPGMTLMLSDEYPEMDLVAPRTAGRATQSVHLHVDDADALVARMIAAGATLKRAVSDSFYGERGGAVLDPFGHEWMVGHSIEEVEPAEMQRRWDAMAGKG